MTIENCRFPENYVFNSNGLAQRGTISNTGQLSIIDTRIDVTSVISNNGNALGGGIYNKGTTEINGSTLSLEE